MLSFSQKPLTGFWKSMQTNVFRVCAYFCDITCLSNPGYAAVKILI